jgi:hypothetical protein
MALVWLMGVVSASTGCTAGFRRRSTAFHLIGSSSEEVLDNGVCLNKHLLPKLQK